MHNKIMNTNIFPFISLIPLIALILLAACGNGQTNNQTIAEPNLLPLSPGTYTGAATGYLGEVHVEVEVDYSGRVIRIDVLRHEETPGFAYPTFEIMRTSIINNQSTDVTLITGATATSRAFRDAVEIALVQAGVSLAQLRRGATPPPQGAEFAVVPPSQEPGAELIVDNVLTAAALAALPVSTANFAPGVYTVTVPGFRDAPMTVQVTFSENQIIDIDIIEHDESMYGSGWAFRAMPAVQDQIIVRQSTLDIDAFTGATITRDAIISAVDYTILQAGATPLLLTPQFINSPLPGDRFIPGFIEITVPASAMDVYGNPLTEGAMRMLYSEDTDMNLRISFGRNEFHIHSGGAFGLGQGAYGHGESVYEPDQIGGGALGGWWFRQVVNHQINDRQSTQNIDIATGATMSAAAIVWGVEQAMINQGATPSEITPITYPLTRFQRHPDNTVEDPFFLPGLYTVTVNGWGGPMVVRVTFDRSNIRRIEVLEHNETDSFWDSVWGPEANHILRDAIFEAGPAEIDSVDVVTGATYSSTALIEAVRAAMEQAWIR